MGLFPFALDYLVAHQFSRRECDWVITFPRFVVGRLGNTFSHLLFSARIYNVEAKVSTQNVEIERFLRCLLIDKSECPAVRKELKNIIFFRRKYFASNYSSVHVKCSVDNLAENFMPKDRKGLA